MSGVPTSRGSDLVPLVPRHSRFCNVMARLALRVPAVRLPRRSLMGFLNLRKIHHQASSSLGLVLANLFPPLPHPSLPTSNPRHRQHDFRGNSHPAYTTSWCLSPCRTSRPHRNSVALRNAFQVSLFPISRFCHPSTLVYLGLFGYHYRSSRRSMCKSLPLPETTST